MVSPIGNDLDLSSFGLTPTEQTDKGKLGQEEFLKLMITQLKNQDPFKPLESGAFLGQLAQFGTVSGLADLKTSFDGLATSLVSNQALQAAGLIGRSVLVTGPAAYYESGTPLTGAVRLPAASNTVRVQISDATGQVVQTLELGGQAAGLVRFGWDGIQSDGTAAAPGIYTVQAQYLDGKEMLGAPTSIRADVDSVTLGTQGLAVQLRGLGTVPFGDIEEIG